MVGGIWVHFMALAFAFLQGNFSDFGKYIAYHTFVLSDAVMMLANCCLRAKAVVMHIWKQPTIWKAPSLLQWLNKHDAGGFQPKLCSLHCSPLRSGSIVLC